MCHFEDLNAPVDKVTVTAEEETLQKNYKKHEN